VKLLWTEQAWEDYLHWQQSDPNVLEKINYLTKNIGRRPFKGLGKPEPLKGPLSGWWSRCITDEHRLVYRVRWQSDAQVLEIAQCRYYY
jgi:toxin YoeB